MKNFLSKIFKFSIAITVLAIFIIFIVLTEKKVRADDPSVDYVFTNCTQTGRNGPSQEQCNTAYSGTSLEGEVTVASGIQQWTVPSSGTYIISTYGAQGGKGAGYDGGKGAKMSGEFFLNQGEILYILVGQLGGNRAGGGGAFVVLSDDTPLIIAGGGGGTADAATNNTIANATTTNCGVNSAGAGGCDGSGGASSVSSGGSGGGLLTDGADNDYASNRGVAYVNGGAGGNGGYGLGGFGGGGGGGQTAWSGGGGGYSGGGGGSNAQNMGGGGGSYNDGDNQENEAGINEGHGYVEITLISPPVTPDVQALNIVFSSVNYSQMTVGWTNGSGSRRIVFMKEGTEGTVSPVDGTGYTANSIFRDGNEIDGWYAVYNGTGESFTVTGLSPETNYRVQIFEYNGIAGSALYLATTANDNPKSESTIALTTPTEQASSISFSSVNQNQMTIDWTNGNGEARAVFVKQGTSGTASPVDGTNYSANSVFGGGTQIGSTGWYTVYNGTGTSVSVTGLSLATTYLVQVFEYNGSSGEELYLTSSATNNPRTQTTNEAPTGDDFETGDFSANDWSFGGTATNYQWTISSSEKNSGSYSAKAGAYNEHSRTSYMEITLDIAEPGNITYYRKVFSEGGYDFFRFYIDGVQKEVQSGNVPWGQSSYAVDAGNRTFRWQYSKDGSVNTEPDTVWIDDIIFPVLVNSTYDLIFQDYDSSVIESTEYEEGADLSGHGNPADPTRTGYTFTGWSMAVPDTMPAEDVIITAQYSINQYTITFNSDGGAEIDSIIQDYGTAITPPENPIKTGYTFTGWDPVLPITMPAYNETHTAQYTITTYTLNYTTDGNGTIDGEAIQTIEHGQNGTAVEVVPNEGYYFVEWSDGVEDAIRIDINITADKSVEALFSPHQYTLNYTTDGNGAISGESSQVVSYGENGTAVEAVPNEGYDFLKWSDEAEDNPRQDANVTAHISVSAIFSPHQYTVTYSAGDNGSIEGEAVQRVDYGGSGTAINAVPDAFYSFIKWSDERTDNPRIDTNITGDITVAASFADITSPTISNLVAASAEDAATITWTTNESATSILRYGVSANYGVTVSDANLKISHGITIGSLAPCATYYYRVQSKDFYLNSSLVDASFNTLGCAGSAQIIAGKEALADKGIENTISLKLSEVSVLTLIIPINYSDKNAVFQIKKIDKDEALSETGSPENKEKAGNHFYTLIAISDDENLEVINSFNEPITITVNYTQPDIAGLDEDSLKIYRWDGNNWQVLTDCFVNKTNKSVSCATGGFSSFAVFGDSLPDAPPINGGTPGGGGSPLLPPGIGDGANDVVAPGMGLTVNVGQIDNKGKTVLIYITNRNNFSTPQSSNNWQLGDHSFQITDLDLFNNMVTLVFNSQPITVVLEKGESKNIDLDQDGINDINVTFTNVYINRTEITIKSLSQLTTTEPVQPTKPIQPEETKPVSYIFVRDLRLGMSGDDVKELQKYLNNADFPVALSGLGSKNNETTYFGSLTRTALAKWQTAKKISPAVGYFGPISRAKYSELVSLVSIEKPAPIALVLPEVAPIAFQFTRDLKFGIIGSDVRELQKFLNNNNFIIAKSGAGSKDNETNYFGRLTQQALIKFQKAKNISPAVGYFGPITRSFLNN